jgi:hypothetical protein
MGGSVGPRDGLDEMEQWKFVTLPGLELRPLSYPAYLFVYCLFDDVCNMSDYNIRWHDRKWIMKWKLCGGNWEWCNLRCYVRICLEGLRYETKTNACLWAEIWARIRSEVDILSVAVLGVLEKLVIARVVKKVSHLDGKRMFITQKSNIYFYIQLCEYLNCCHIFRLIVTYFHADFLLSLFLKM